MKLNRPLKFAMLLAFLPITVSYADNGAFPPANAVNIRPFPQLMPKQPAIRAVPRSVAPSVQAPVFNRAMAPRVQRQNISRPYPRIAPRYQQYNRQVAPRYPANVRQPSYNRRMPNYRKNTNSQNNNFPLSNNMMPFGGSGNSFNPFSSGNMPFSNGSSGMMPSNPMNNMFGNNNNSKMPFFPSTNNKKRKKAWGTERNIWPDFYTDFTDEGWDTMMSGPRDLGVMPGGWRFPYISMPDPVTVSDAITNQFPPIAEEAGKMADFSDWGVFD